MKFLLDVSVDKMTKLMSHDLIAGQLLTPLTSYRWWGGKFAIDNGAFSRFDKAGFLRLIRESADRMDHLLFVAMPDVVGNGRRTLETFYGFTDQLKFRVPKALVMQDGMEDLPIPWSLFDTAFIGGTTEWKMSHAAADVVRAAVIMGKHIHVGRVNTLGRYRHFADLGAHTCDGSGVARYDHMLDEIVRGLAAMDGPQLWDATADAAQEPRP